MTEDEILRDFPYSENEDLHAGGRFFASLSDWNLGDQGQRGRDEKLAKLKSMPQEIENTETPVSRARLPKGLVLLPPVSLDDLKKDIEHDPDGAEEFVALLRALREPRSVRVTL